jgi:DNA-directed RNA polymerase specialized sigma24 family protein
MVDIDPKEYEFNEWEDDDRMKTIKDALQSLRPVERKIFLTYVESGTYSETARTFKVSVPTAKKYLVEIKNKLLSKIELEDDNRSIDADDNS